MRSGRPFRRALALLKWEVTCIGTISSENDAGSRLGWNFDEAQLPKNDRRAQESGSFWRGAGPPYLIHCFDVCCRSSDCLEGWLRLTAAIEKQRIAGAPLHPPERHPGDNIAVLQIDPE